MHHEASEVRMKYPAKESSTIEFKRELPSKQEIAKSIIGFCNLYGGRLIIGIEDSGEIVGIPELGIDELIESVQQSIYHNCTPTILPEISAQRIEDKIILIIEVSEGMNKPYYHTSKGTEEGTYLRMGRQTMRASPELINELKWQAKGRSPDSKPVYQASVEDLDLDAVERFFKNRIQKEDGNQNDSLEEMMIHYKILVKDHSRILPSMGGMLLFGKNPQQYISEAFIIGTHFEGVSGREALATRDFKKTLFDQFHEAVAFVISRLNRQFSIKGAGPREERLEIPEIAIREVILNALVHRDYFLPGPSKIAIYDDRIEIFSPGTFPGPLNDRNLEAGITYIRNFVISRILREAGYIEKLGSGFLTLFKTYREENLPPPVVSEGAGFIKCILPRRTLKRGPEISDAPEQQVMKLVLIHTEIQAADVIRELSISRATASRLLKKLVEQELLIKSGIGSATKYRRKEF
jgi:ATP-dependent DNA helicase RecG